MSYKLRIPVTLSELKLDYTLQSGQCFRWLQFESTKWLGVINSDIWILHQDSNYLYCNVIPDAEKALKTADISLNDTKIKIENVDSEISASKDPLVKKSLKNENTKSICSLAKKRALLKRSKVSIQDSLFQQEMIEEEVKPLVSEWEKKIKAYFRLEMSLDKLYEEWSHKDDHFALVSRKFPGIRMLDQNPVENVFSFICSSNNNIKRISSLVNHLCREFGSCIGKMNGENIHSFPNVESLAACGTEERLRELGFGYRAKYIHSSAKTILEKGGAQWLEQLRNLNYKNCRSEISKLAGVGPKVADCICLMSMNHLDSIPVDTHVFQIAVRDYLPHLGGKKSLTPKVYDEIGDHFRGLFGPCAGWAHSVLFTSDLTQFKSKDPAKRRRT